MRAYVISGLLQTSCTVIFRTFNIATESHILNYHSRIAPISATPQ
ncbi:hypothetical protein HMPREF3197_00429 [Klebsiella pneumoniae]|nr:hypothetical protein HMPREF9538_02132 [Klebsiella sp. MS 92-3]KXA30160.1 hypothetical protein HMPREF3197_00429 [Klebsiella pneumoniae]